MRRGADRSLHQRDEAFQQRDWGRRAARNMKSTGIRRQRRRRRRSCRKNAAVERAGARPRPPISAPASRHRCAAAPRACSWSPARYQQHVGVARRGDEPQAEALQVVVGVGERVDFQFAAVAGAGVDLREWRGCARSAASSAWLRAAPASAASSAIVRRAGAPRSAALQHGSRTGSCAWRAA